MLFKVISYLSQCLGEGGVRDLRRDGDHDLTGTVGDDVGEAEMAFPLGRAPSPDGQQPRQTAVGRPVGGKREQAGGVGEVEARADNEADASPPGGLVRPDGAGQGVAVGNGAGRVSQVSSLVHQFLGTRGPAQETEVAGHLKLGVSGHGRVRSAARPCST